MQTIGFARHDHQHCIASTIEAAATRCAAEGLQFTPVRRRVLEILLERHRAMGAYDILEILRDEGMGAQPPVAYRALDFLIAHGFAHRIELLNAFIACHHPDERHTPAFLICRACNAVAEAPSGPSREGLNATAAAAGFTVERSVVEATGLCPNCADEGRRT
ncbi:transcriptional repressor [Roseibacterium sp. SDUM158017]|uniref:transcriptional repressor n=1 Tax=Roseicyclus salinarum TaxID=3036773 RepID=UPI0024151BC8|nr:transcriptional repressor [Roseibacterium sp. SDUM158017]MDG4649681.1 transcriptional repressor [Roseibacterium sp. SDUM158017]